MTSTITASKTRITPPTTASNRSGTRAGRCAGRSTLDEELTVRKESFTIHQNLSISTSIANHIPMHRRFVYRAGLRIRLSGCHVNSATDLFIEQDISGEAIDKAIGADGKFAQVTRPGVGIQH